MKYLLLTTFILLISISTYANPKFDNKNLHDEIDRKSLYAEMDRKGNGGDAVVCFYHPDGSMDLETKNSVDKIIELNKQRDDKRDPLAGINLNYAEVEFFDLYLKRQPTLDGQIELIESDQSFKKIIEERIDIISTKSNYANVLLDLKSRLPFSSFIGINSGVYPVNDSEHVNLDEANCSLLQLAIRYKVSSQLRVTYDRRLFNKMSKIDQAAFVMHEWIYVQATDERRFVAKHKNSKLVRELVGLIFTQNFQYMSGEEFRDALYNYKLASYHINSDFADGLDYSKEVKYRNEKYLIYREGSSYNQYYFPRNGETNLITDYYHYYILARPGKITIHGHTLEIQGIFKIYETGNEGPLSINLLNPTTYIELPACGEITFFDNEKTKSVDICEEVEFNEMYFLKDQSLYFHENGLFWGGILSRPKTINGIKYKENEQINFHDSTNLFMGTLADDNTTINNLMFSKNDKVFFYDNGKLFKSLLSENLTINDLIFKKDYYIYFHENKNVKNGMLANNSYYFEDIKSPLPSGTWVGFNQNSKLTSFSINEDYKYSLKVFGLTLSKGHKGYFDKKENKWFFDLCDDSSKIICNGEGITWGNYHFYGHTKSISYDVSSNSYYVSLNKDEFFHVAHGLQCNRASFYYKSFKIKSCDQFVSRSSKFSIGKTKLVLKTSKDYPVYFHENEHGLLKSAHIIGKYKLEGKRCGIKDKVTPVEYHETGNLKSCIREKNGFNGKQVYKYNYNKDGKYISKEHYSFIK